MTSRFLIDDSSEARFAKSEMAISHDGSIRYIVASRLAQTVYSQNTLLRLTNELIHFAEQAYALRDLDALKETSRILMNIPADGARQIGLYYYALAINRQGLNERAEVLLATVADSAPITYRARAIQTLGANLHDTGQLDEALKFQVEALQAASDKNAQGLQTTLLAHLEISHFKSDTGDHRGALATLENIWPLVRISAKENPLYFYFYHNELAVELGELGRIADAKAASKIALASPYSAAYPNWAETRQELEEKRTCATPSIVAVTHAPEADTLLQVEPQSERKHSRTLALSWLRTNKDQFQISVIPNVASAAINGLTQGIIEWIHICIGPRAPPALSSLKRQ